MFRRFGHPVINYGPEGGGDGGGNPPAGGGNPPAGGAQPWFSGMPDGPAKELMGQKQYADPNALADAYYHLNRYVSANNMIVVPDDDATPEQRNEFFAKLGRPEAPDKYEIKLPEGYQADESLLGFARTTGHELGLNNKQMQTLADKWTEFVGVQNDKTLADLRAQNDLEVAKLKETWGDKFNSYVEAGKRAVQSLKLDADDMAKIEAHTGAGWLVNILARLGSMGGENGAFNGNNGGGGGDPNNPSNMTPQAAQAKIDALMGDAKWYGEIYANKNHPEHKTAVELMNALMARSMQAS